MSTLIRTISLLVLVASIAWGQGSAPDPDREQEPLDRLVWQALDADPAEARAVLRRLKKRAPSASEVHAVLDAGRSLVMPAAGILEDQPLPVPGTKVSTSYLLGIPEGLEPGRRYPLWIGIHGTGGRARHEFGPLMRARGSRKLFIAAIDEADDIHGQGWGYRERERAMHTALIDRLARRYPIDRSRVFLVGHSRGGHASFDLAARFSDRFAGAVPVIGAFPWRDLPLVENLHHVRLHAMNGERDQPALVEGARRAVARLQELGYPASQLMDPERGHVGFYREYPAAMALMEGRRREVAPRKLSLRVQDPLHGRHYWLRVTHLGREAYETGDPIVIPPDTPKDEKARRAAWARGIAERTAGLKARWSETGVVDIETHHVTRFQLFFPAALCNPGDALEIRINGKVWRKRQRIPRPNGVRLIEHLRAFGTRDESFRFHGKLDVRVPRR